MTLSASNTLKQVKYFYERSENNPTKEVVISYKNVQFNPTFGKNEFSEKKYFNKINGTEVLTVSYNNYTLLKGGF